MLIGLVGILTFLSAFPVFAHPVIYKDGIVASSSNMQSYSDNQLMYSWSSRWSTGLNHWRFTKEDKNTEADYHCRIAY